MEDIKSNLLKSVPKIQNFIYLHEPNEIGLPKVELSDWEVYKGRLNMVLISVIITVESDQDLDGFVSHLNIIKNKMERLLDKLSFDDEGNLTKPNNSMVMYSGGSLIHKCDFDGDELTLDIGFMFHGEY
jgi:hypothetical protein